MLFVRFDFHHPHHLHFVAQNSTDLYVQGVEITE
jgi:hypothetical protein